MRKVLVLFGLYLLGGEDKERGHFGVLGKLQVESGVVDNTQVAVEQENVHDFNLGYEFDGALFILFTDQK